MLTALLAAPCGATPPQQSAAAASDRFLRAGAAEVLPEPVASGVACIDSAALATRIAFLAAPSLGGRGLASEGLEAALDYVASSLALAGVPPLAATTDGSSSTASYFQPVRIREVRDLSGYLNLEFAGNGDPRGRVFSCIRDCVVPPVALLNLEAPVVFAGHGIREPSLDHDDYRDLDVRGTLVVVLSGVPKGPQWQAPSLRARYAAEDPEERHTTKLELASALGAVAMVALEGDEWTLEDADGQRSGASFFLPSSDRAAEPPLLRVSPAVSEFLGEVAGKPLAGSRPRALAGLRARLVAAGVERDVTSRNVVAALAGGDAGLRDEAVILGAHVDHLGRVADTIYPGADDNASGVAALIEIAKAVVRSSQRPKRTLLFAFWTGEEEGKLGSGDYVRHPLWPLAKTVAYINLDMIGHRFALDEIKMLVEDAGLPGGDVFLDGLQAGTFVEVGLPTTTPELAEALRRAARGLGVDLHLDYTSGVNGGSDYRDFARAGVPFLRFFGNFFPGYHEPDDTPEKVDVTAVRQQARLALATAWFLADR